MAPPVLPQPVKNRSSRPARQAKNDAMGSKHVPGRVQKQEHPPIILEARRLRVTDEWRLYRVNPQSQPHLPYPGPRPEPLEDFPGAQLDFMRMDRVPPAVKSRVAALGPRLGPAGLKFERILGWGAHGVVALFSVAGSAQPVCVKTNVWGDNRLVSAEKENHMVCLPFLCFVASCFGAFV